MAQRLYDYALNRMADAIFATAVTVSARTSMPGNDGTGGEISGNGYSDITMQANQFANAGAGSAAAGAVVATADADFGSASGGNWGTISHLIFLEGANLVGWVTLSEARVINDGDQLIIPMAEIAFSVTART